VDYTGEGLARFIRGDGSAIQMGEGDDVLTNTGTITGGSGRAINMEGGNDVVNFNAGAITGDIDGGAGTDTLNLGAGVANGSAIKRFEQINVGSGSATLSGVVSGDTLGKSGAGALVLEGANTLTGLVTVDEGRLVVNNLTGSATGFGDVFVNTGAILAGDGIIAGNVTFDGILAPGNSIGTLTVQGDVTWNGDAGNAWQFELGLGDVSDRLLIEGDFLKGTGTEYVFDFLSGAVDGDFVLVEWGGTTDFTAEDFGYVGLAGGFAGTFAIDGNQLVFSAVPEPATAGALMGLGALGVAALRRRRVR
jgi:autotransporter-associated beta strand protein